MKVRFAVKEDGEQILNLLDELLDEVNLKSGKKPKATHGKKARLALYAQLLNRKDVKIFVVEDKRKLIAVADVFVLPIMRRGYFQGHIEDLVVTETLRGKGIGTLLLKEILDYCKSQSIKVIKLTSALELAQAHAFYEKNGGRSTEKMFRFDL